MENQYTVLTDVAPSAIELAGLFSQTYWADKRSHEELERLLENTGVFVAVRAGDSLVGYGRALSDGVYRALLDDIVVDEAHRGQGVGRIIVESLRSQLSGVEQVYLNTNPDMEGFYNKYGFEKFQGLTMRRQ